MLRALLILTAYTFVPALELRFSIPYGLYQYRDILGLAGVVGVCVVANIALAPLVWLFVDRGIQLFLRFAWIERLWDRLVLRARGRIEPYVERYGTLGLALFVGVPLPGSGVYTGGLGAYLLGFGLRRYMVASVVGVLIAATAITVVVLTGATAFEVFLKH